MLSPFAAHLAEELLAQLVDRLMLAKGIDEEGKKVAAFASAKVNEHLERKMIRKIVAN